MIKNDNQLARAENQLGEINRQISALDARHSARDARFWARPLEDEAAKIQAEMDEYRLLSQLTLEKAVEGPLRSGALLENTGELLAKLRIAAGLTQAQLAERLGWDQPNISRFESANYSGQTLDKISEYLDGIGVWLHVYPSLSETPLSITFHTSERSHFLTLVAEDTMDTFAAGMLTADEPTEMDDPLSPVGSLAWLQKPRTARRTAFKTSVRVILEPISPADASVTP